jgi:hypothetical protein
MNEKMMRDMEEPAELFDDDALHEIIEHCRLLKESDSLMVEELEPVFQYVERGLSDLVVIEGATIRGGSKVSSELRVKKGDAVFTILVSDEVATRLGAFVGGRVTLLLRPE